MVTKVLIVFASLRMWLVESVRDAELLDVTRLMVSDSLVGASPDVTLSDKKCAKAFDVTKWYAAEAVKFKQVAADTFKSASHAIADIKECSDGRAVFQFAETCPDQTPGHLEAWTAYKAKVGFRDDTGALEDAGRDNPEGACAAKCFDVNKWYASKSAKYQADPAAIFVKASAAIEAIQGCDDGRAAFKFAKACPEDESGHNEAWHAYKDAVGEGRGAEPGEGYDTKEAACSLGSMGPEMRPNGNVTLTSKKCTKTFDVTKWYAAESVKFKQESADTFKSASRAVADIRGCSDGRAVFQFAETCPDQTPGHPEAWTAYKAQVGDGDGTGALEDAGRDKPEQACAAKCFNVNKWYASKSLEYKPGPAATFLNESPAIEDLQECDDGRVAYKFAKPCPDFEPRHSEAKREYKAAVGGGSGAEPGQGFDTKEAACSLGSMGPKMRPIGDVTLSDKKCAKTFDVTKWYATSSVKFNRESANTFKSASQAVADIKACPDGRAVFQFAETCPSQTPGHSEAWTAYKAQVGDSDGKGALLDAGRDKPEEACAATCFDVNKWYAAKSAKYQADPAVTFVKASAAIEDIQGCDDGRAAFKFAKPCPRDEPGHNEAWRAYRDAVGGGRGADSSEGYDTKDAACFPRSMGPEMRPNGDVTLSDKKCAKTFDVTKWYAAESVKFKQDSAVTFKSVSQAIADIRGCPDGRAVFQFAETCPDQTPGHPAAWTAYKAQVGFRDDTGALEDAGRDNPEEACAAKCFDVNKWYASKSAKYQADPAVTFVKASAAIEDIQGCDDGRAAFKFAKACPRDEPGHTEAWRAYKDAVGEGRGAEPGEGHDTKDAACSLGSMEPEMRPNGNVTVTSKRCAKTFDVTKWYAAESVKFNQGSADTFKSASQAIADIKGCSDGRAVFQFAETCPDQTPGHPEAWTAYKAQVGFRDDTGALEDAGRDNPEEACAAKCFDVNKWYVSKSAKYQADPAVTFVKASAAIEDIQGCDDGRAAFKFAKPCPRDEPGHKEAWRAYRDAVGEGRGAEPGEGYDTKDAACSLGSMGPEMRPNGNVTVTSKRCTKTFDVTKWYAAESVKFKRESADTFKSASRAVANIRGCSDGRAVFQFAETCPDQTPGHPEAWTAYKAQVGEGTGALEDAGRDNPEEACAAKCFDVNKWYASKSAKYQADPAVTFAKASAAIEDIQGCDDGRAAFKFAKACPEDESGHNEAWRAYKNKVGEGRGAEPGNGQTTLEAACSQSEISNADITVKINVNMSTKL